DSAIETAGTFCAAVDPHGRAGDCSCPCAALRDIEDVLLRGALDRHLAFSVPYEAPSDSSTVASPGAANAGELSRDARRKGNFGDRAPGAIRLGNVKRQLLFSPELRTFSDSGAVASPGAAHSVEGPET